MLELSNDERGGVGEVEGDDHLTLLKQINILSTSIRARRWLQRVRSDACFGDVVEAAHVWLRYVVGIGSALG